MSRFPTLSIDQAPADSRLVLEQIQQQMGRVPNILAAMATSPAALRFYAQGNEILASGVLDDATREAIALAVGGSNGCRYCASAHGAKAQMLGSDADEIARNLAGRSEHAHTAVLVSFAHAVSQRRGWANEDLATARAHGASDEELIEVIALVAFNTFTNYFNHLNETDLDFPAIDPPA